MGPVRLRLVYGVVAQVLLNCTTYRDSGEYPLHRALLCALSSKLTRTKSSGYEKAKNKSTLCGEMRKYFGFEKNVVSDWSKEAEKLIAQDPEESEEEFRLRQKEFIDCLEEGICNNALDRGLEIAVYLLKDIIQHDPEIRPDTKVELINGLTQEDLVNKNHFTSAAEFLAGILLYTFTERANDNEIVDTDERRLHATDIKRRYDEAKERNEVRAEVNRIFFGDRLQPHDDASSTSGYSDKARAWLFPLMFSDSKTISKTYVEMRNYYNDENYTRAYKNLPILEEELKSSTHESIDEAEIHMGIGVVYTYKGEHELAESHFSKAIISCKVEGKLTYATITSLYRAANYYCIEDMRNFYKSCSSVYRFGEAALKNSALSEWERACVFRDMGIACFRQEDYNGALAQFARAYSNPT